MLGCLVGEDDAFVGAPSWLGREVDLIDLVLLGLDGSPEAEGLEGLTGDCSAGAGSFSEH